MSNPFSHRRTRCTIASATDWMPFQQKALTHADLNHLMLVLGTKTTWYSLGVNSLGWNKYSILCVWCKLVSQVVEMGQYWFFFPLHTVKVSTDPQLPLNTDFFAVHTASPDLFQVSIFIRLDLDDCSPGKSVSPLIASLNSFACYHVPSLPLNVWLSPLSVRMLCCQISSGDTWSCSTSSWFHTLQPSIFYSISFHQATEFCWTCLCVLSSFGPSWWWLGHMAQVIQLSFIVFSVYIL